MKADDQRPGFGAIVDRAIREGRNGRTEILDRLTAMPVEKLASVPPSALALLGPGGLGELARRRSDLAGLAPKPVSGTPRMETAKAGHRKPTETGGSRFSTLWLVCAIVAAALSLDLALPLLQKPSGDPLPRNADEWPRCARLDRLTDGCVYRTGGGHLTLERAAGHLAIHPDELKRLNPHLTGLGDRPLPAGSPVVVLRDIGRVERNRR